MKNKLPPCFAFKNSGKHPRKDEIKKRFNALAGYEFKFTLSCILYYGRTRCGKFDFCEELNSFGSTVVKITEDNFLAMTEPELTKLPKNFAFKYTGKHQFKGEIERRFIEIKGYKYPEFHPEMFYGKKENGDVDWCNSKIYFGKDVVEITEQQFLDLTEPKSELTKLPDNFYFQYVDEKDREVLKERFGRGSDFCCPTSYYGKLKESSIFQSFRESSFEGATKITQQDFIRLTEPEKIIKPMLQELPKNFYFQLKESYPNGELIRERAKKLSHTNWTFDFQGAYYSLINGVWKCTGDLESIKNKSIEITQDDFIRLTEPKQSLAMVGELKTNNMEKEKRYKKKDFVKAEWIKSVTDEVTLVFKQGSPSYVRVLEAGVLEAWFEEIKEPEEIKYILNFNRVMDADEATVIISKDGFKYSKDGTLIYYKSLVDLYKILTTTKVRSGTHALDVFFKTVDIGCLKDILLSDIEKLLDLYQSNFLK